MQVRKKWGKQINRNQEPNIKSSRTIRKHVSKNGKSKWNFFSRNGIELSFQRMLLMLLLMLILENYVIYIFFNGYLYTVNCIHWIGSIWYTTKFINFIYSSLKNDTWNKLSKAMKWNRSENVIEHLTIMLNSKLQI